MEERHLIGAELEIEVRDKNGKLIEHRKQESKSFVKQFIDMLYGLMKAKAGTENIIDITQPDGTTYGYPNLISLDKGILTAVADAGVDKSGIVVGSSDEAVGYDDYNLKSKIANGTGAGQLSYGACVVDTPYKDGTEYKFRIYRTFTNNSGDTITVKEVGLIVAYRDITRCALLIRDVLDSPESIPDGATFTVRYYIKIIVP